MKARSAVGLIAAGVQPDDVVLDPTLTPVDVTIAGAIYKRLANGAACDKAPTGWCVTAPGRLRLKLAEVDVQTRHTFRVEW